MSNPTVTCPHCQTLLRSDRPLSVGMNSHCPDCKNNFIAPANNGSLQLPGPAAARMIGPAFFIAVAVSLVLGGAIVTAAFILTSRRPPAEVTQTDRTEDERKRLEEERQKLADARAQRERETHKAEGDRLIAKNAADAERKTKLEVDRLPNSDTSEKKNLAEYKQHMDAAKAAMLAERYPDAVREFVAALRLMPNDLEAQQGQKQALARIAGLGDKEKRQKALDGADR